MDSVGDIWHGRSARVPRDHEPRGGRYTAAGHVVSLPARAGPKGRILMTCHAAVVSRESQQDASEDIRWPVNPIEDPLEAHGNGQPGGGDLDYSAETSRKHFSRDDDGDHANDGHRGMMGLPCSDHSSHGWSSWA